MEWMQHYLYKHIKLLETYASVKEAIINGIISIRHNTVCLTSSFFTLVFLFSFTSVLYNLSALTFNIKIIGITIIFCKNNDAKENNIPLPSS